MIQRKIVSLFVIAALTACGSKSKKQADEQPVATAEVPTVQPKTDDVVPEVTPENSNPAPIVEPEGVVTPAAPTKKTLSGNGTWQSDCIKQPYMGPKILTLTILDGSLSEIVTTYEDALCTKKMLAFRFEKSLSSDESESNLFAAKLILKEAFRTNYVYGQPNFQKEMLVTKTASAEVFIGNTTRGYVEYSTLLLDGDTLSIADSVNATGEFAQKIEDVAAKKLTVLKKVQ